MATAVAIGLALASAISAPTDGESRGREEASDVRPRPEAVPEDAHYALVESVIDGDTLRVTATTDVHPGTNGSVVVRLLNIDAPEFGRDGRPPECGATEATEFLEALLGPGDRVWLAGDREDRDRFDRSLRGAWTSDGIFVNERLAARGWADDLLVPPNDRFLARIEDAVARARSAGRGIWGPTCSR